MTEIPEHLLRRSRAARQKAGLPPEPAGDTEFGLGRRQLGDLFGPEKDTNPANGPATLVDAIAEIKTRFDVTVIPVPEGMQSDDAQMILEAFSGMGDMSREFTQRMAEIVGGVVAQHVDGLHEAGAAEAAWAAPSNLMPPASIDHPLGNPATGTSE